MPFLKVQKHHYYHLFPEALTNETIKMVGLLSDFLSFLTIPTHLSSFVSYVLKDGYSEKLQNLLTLLLSSLNLRAPGPLDLDGAIIAGCCTASHSLP